MSGNPESVSKDGKVGVFLTTNWEGENGEGVARLLLSIHEIKKLESLASLTGPKFMDAMNDAATQRQLRKAIRGFCMRVDNVGVISVRREHE